MRIVRRLQLGTFEGRTDYLLDIVIFRIRYDTGDVAVFEESYLGAFLRNLAGIKRNRQLKRLWTKNCQRHLFNRRFALFGGIRGSRATYGRVVIDNHGLFEQIRQVDIRIEGLKRTVSLLVPVLGGRTSLTTGPVTSTSSSEST